MFKSWYYFGAYQRTPWKLIYGYMGLMNDSDADNSQADLMETYWNRDVEIMRWKWSGTAWQRG